MEQKYPNHHKYEHLSVQNELNLKSKISQLAQTQRLKSPRLINDCIQFHITRYAFPPHRLFDDKVKYYKTYYECEGFQLTAQMMSRLTNLNRFDNFIKLKQIMKNVSKPNRLAPPQFAKVHASTYSLCYEVIQHSILSEYSTNFFKSQKKSAIQLAQLLEYLTQFLIKSKIYYLWEIQNIGLNDKGKVKVYVPANFIIESTKLTAQKQTKMRNTAKVIGQWFTNINHYPGSIDVQDVKHQIQKELQKIEIKTMNIESQIFTFNENAESNYQKQLQNCHLRVQELDKTVKIRKASQKIQMNPFTINQKNEIFLNIKDNNSKIPKCVTTRDQVKHYEDFEIKEEQHSMDEEVVPSLNRAKDHEFLNQKMKEYEDKLNSINSAVKQIKQLLTTKKQQKGHHNKSKKQLKQKQKYQNQQIEQIQGFVNQNQPLQLQKSHIADKLQQSRIYIKTLLNKENSLSRSFHVQDQNASYYSVITQQVREQKYNKNSQILSDNSKRKKNIQIDVQKMQTRHPDKYQVNKNEQIPQFEYQSSLGKYSPPGGNPFREYRPIRFQYAINNHENRPNSQLPQQNINQNIGFINIFPERYVQPFQNIGGNQIHVQGHDHSLVQNMYQIPQNQHPNQLNQPFFFSTVNPRDPYRLSCFAVRKNQKDELEYIEIPYHHPFQNSENGSQDTFQMQFGKQHDKMPKIVKNNAYRHTLWPTEMKNRLSSKCESNTKGSPRNNQGKLNQGNDSLKGSGQIKKQTRDQRNKRFYQSAGGHQFLKAVREAIEKQGNLSQRQYSTGKDNKKNQNRIMINIKQPVINQSVEHSYMTMENSHILEQEQLPQKSQISQKSRTKSNHNPIKASQIIRQKSHGAGKMPIFNQAQNSEQKLKFQQKVRIQKQTLRGYQDKVKELLNKSKKAIMQFKKGNMKNH